MTSSNLRVIPALLIAAVALSPSPLAGMEASSDAGIAIVDAPERPLPRPSVPRDVVRERASRAGWIGDEWRCLDLLIWRESRWDPKAANRTSTARGLFQRLNEKPNLPVEDQARLGLKYVRERYGSPCKALAHSFQHGWY